MTICYSINKLHCNNDNEMGMAIIVILSSLNSSITAQYIIFNLRKVFNGD